MLAGLIILRSVWFNLANYVQNDGTPSKVCLLLIREIIFPKIELYDFNRANLVAKLNSTGLHFYIMWGINNLMKSVPDFQVFHYYK